MAAPKKSDLTDIPEKATPLKPGAPVAVASAMGATFAERAKARKAVQSAENKAVTRGESK